jgi:isoamylase
MKGHVGSPFPLGATWDGKGTNFALYSANATGVELCLFNQPGDTKEAEKIIINECTGFIWHIYLPGIMPGQLYAYRVQGPYEPQQGHRFNANKLLQDPYAKSLAGTIQWNEALFGYQFGNEAQDLSFSETDSAPFLPKCVVIDPAFDWEGDQLLRHAWHNTVIYEAHVKGLTKLHPDVPENLRGTFAGIYHPAVITYLKELGITALELMPVQQFVNDHMLVEKGLSNYWGYNTIGYFSPDVRYSGSGAYGGQVSEFRQMVKALHQAGIEVILDVVFNHTGEGNQMGPTLSFRGIDNASYYKLSDENKRYYMDYTGTGNTLNTNLPNVLRLIMDSLRYWVLDMHVDGFRFDLASALARELYEVDRLSSFFDIIHQDPVLSQVKLIAEPWDVGEGGYQVGNFPPGWSEWNGRYRDCVRDYWRGAESMLGDFAQRFTGSADLYQGDTRKPTASINFITAHDGFTLLDLVSYNEKHNERNGENNNDGESHNRSWNCGAEGPTEDKDILTLRKKQQHNFLATLFLSQGVPMLVAGDECGRSQQGNNNAYCQDNELTWFHWDKMDQELLEFTRSLIRFRSDHPVFHRRRWFQGQRIHGSGVEDIAWFLPNGSEMQDQNWEHDFAKSLAVFLNGKALRVPGLKGERLADDSFYAIFNAHHEIVPYTLPEKKYAGKWLLVMDTARGFSGEKITYEAGGSLQVEARSLVLLQSQS